MGSPPTFDPFYVDVFSGLSSGSTLIWMSPDMKCRPRSLTDLLIKEKVDFMQITPTLLINISTYDQIFDQIKHFVIGGEPFPNISGNRSKRSRFWNIYGVSEMSCWQSMVEIVNDCGPFPVGSSLSETKIDIGNDSEIIVSSDTRICRIIDSNGDVSDSSSVRTGDFGHFDENGSIYVDGRIDQDQLKINGKRTSIREIERSVKYLMSGSSIVKAFKFENKVVISVISSEEDKDKILRNCRENLPSHLVPYDVMIIKEFPITKNGKVDIKRLENSYKTLNVSKKLSDDSIVQLWIKFTGLEPRDDSNFITDGGNSLSAVELVEHIGVIEEKPSLLDVLLNETFKDVTRLLKDNIRKDLLSSLSSANCFKHDSKFDQNESIEDEIKIHGSKRSASIESLRQLWIKFTALEPRDDSNFITDGGNSLSAVELVERVNAIEEKPFLLDVLLNETFKDVVRLLKNNVRIDPLSDSSSAKRFKGANDSVEHQIKIHHENKRSASIESLRQLWIKFTSLEPRDYSNFITDGGNSVSAVELVEHLDVVEEKQSLLSVLLNETFKDVIRVIRRGSSRMKGWSCRGETWGEFGNNLGSCSSFEWHHLWSVDLEKCIDASPLIVEYEDKTLAFVGSHKGCFKSVNVETSETLWTRYIEGRIEGSASVSICGQRIYFGSYNQRLYCLSSTSGRVIWTFDTEGIVKCKPTVVSEKLIIFGSYDHHVYCITDGGILVWKINFHGSVLASPCVEEDHLIIGCLDGSVSKYRGIEDPIKQWTVSCGAPIFNGLRLVGKKVICINVKGLVRILNSDDGILVWEYDLKSTTFSGLLTIRDLAIFGSHNCQVFCLNLKTMEISSAKMTGPVFATPCVAGNKDIITLSTDGTISLISLETFVIKNQSRIAKDTFSSSPVVHKDKIIFGSRENLLTCFSMKKHFSE